MLFRTRHLFYLTHVKASIPRSNIADLEKRFFWEKCFAIDCEIPSLERLSLVFAKCHQDWQRLPGATNIFGAYIKGSVTSKNANPQIYRLLLPIPRNLWQNYMSSCRQKFLTFFQDFAHIKIKPVYLKSPKAFQLLDYGDKSERQT